MPLFESLDAIAIAAADAREPRAPCALRRRRRALPQPRAAPAARLLALSGRPRSGHRDLVRRQRLVGPRVRERLPRDRRAALPARRRTRAALHRRGRLGPARRAGSGGTPPTPTRPARRWPRARCWRRCSTSRPTRASRSPRRSSSSRGRTRAGFSAADGLYAASTLDATPDRLHRGAADLRAGAALPADRRAAPNANAPSALKGTALDRFGYLLDFSPAVRRDLPAVDARPVRRSTATRTLYRPRRRQRARRADARAATAEGLYLLSWNGETLPAQLRAAGDAPDAGRHDAACSPGWPSTAAARPEARGSDAERAARRCGRTTWSGSSRLSDEHHARVAADEVAGAHPPRAERALDRLGHLLRAARPRLGRCPRAPCPSPRAPARTAAASSGGISTRSASRAALVPDRRRHRARLDQRDLHARAVQLDAQRVADRLDRVLGGRVGSGERPSPRGRRSRRRTRSARARARSAGSSARVTATWPNTLTSNWRRRSSSASISSGPPTPMPALLTSASRPPCAGARPRARSRRAARRCDLRRRRSRRAISGITAPGAGALGAQAARPPPGRARPRAPSSPRAPGAARWRGRCPSRRR